MFDRFDGHDPNFHAKKRAAERYGLYLTDYDLEKIARQIQAKQATWVRREATGRCVWDVKSAWNTVCRVVYDPNRRQVVTFLHKNGAEGG